MRLELRQHASKRAFTLLEIIVVMGIIALLIGLMFPAIQSARQSADRVERLNWKRQRQLDEPPPRRIPYRILFIGNSHTVNGGLDIPDALAELSRQGRKAEIRSTCVVVGGQTLEGHWKTGLAREVIRNGETGQTGKGTDWFDFVVLQDQSQWPCALLSSYLEYNERFGMLGKEFNAIPMVYQLFERTSGFICPQFNLTNASIDAVKAIQGDEGTGEISPVGEAWKIAREKRPSLELHLPDGNHANEAGGYLTALVFYSVIHRSDPKGLPSAILTPNNKISIAADDASFLQEVAWETSEKWRKKTRAWFLNGSGVP
ncbi:MAG: type II secretion system protein [Planctomycetes bacterium]|nr:type II secretion system protein [Planctomycetota bacterium]NBY03007.1 type II secretion system protein [Planctomycetota bacterium]